MDLNKDYKLLNIFIDGMDFEIETNNGEIGRSELYMQVLVKNEHLNEVITELEDALPKGNNEDVFEVIEDITNNYAKKDIVIYLPSSESIMLS